ncbi:MAG: DHH family phosphoesterase [bacterium]
MKEDYTQEFKSYLKNLLEENEKKIKIIMHDVPDPDAMGSAVGMAMIMHLFGINSEIYHRSEISHPQNKTLINVLNLTFKKLTDDEKISGPLIVVDGTENNSAALIEIKNNDFVIDHHKSNTKAQYNIIDPSYGSCSTMVWQLFHEAKDFDFRKKDINYSEYTNTLTAMLLGIRTDTNDLTSENMIKDDFVAYQELLELVDKEALQKVMNYPFPKYLYDRRIDLHKDGNYAESTGVFVVGIGFISNSHRDVIAVLAEEYARMESVNTSIIFAIVGGNTLQVSVRSSNISLDVGALCKELFGEYGGGKSYKGGASIPLNFYSGLENGEKEKFWNVTCKHMFKKILKEGFEDTSKE